MRWIGLSLGLITVVASQCALAQGATCSPNPCVDPPMQRPVPIEPAKPGSPRVITTDELQTLGVITGIKGTDKDKQPAQKKQVPAKPDEKAKKDASKPTDK